MLIKEYNIAVGMGYNKLCS